MKKIKLAWVGSGFVGQVAHLVNYASLPNVEISSLAELRKNLGVKICNKFNIKKFYNNHLELIDNEKPDAVIAVVNRRHTASVAKDILLSGNNLFTEKPMAATYEQAKKLVNIAKAKKSTYFIGNMRLSDDGIQSAKKYYLNYLRNNKLGKIISFRTYCFAGGDYCNIEDEYIKTHEPTIRNIVQPIAPKWVKKKNHYEFEKFLNYFVHDMGLINFFFEEEPKIENVYFNKRSGSVMLNYKKFYGTFEFAYLDNNAWDEGLEINFEKGKIKISLPPAFLRNQPATIEITNYKKNSYKIVPNVNWTWSFKKQAENFISLIKKKKFNISSAESSLRDIQIVENIWKQII